VLPLFPLPGALLLPRGQMPLNIFEPRYIAMIDEALRTHRLIGMIQPDTDSSLRARSSDLFTVGAPVVSRSSLKRATIVISLL